MDQLVMFYDPEETVQPDQYAIEFGKLLNIYHELRPMRVLEIGTRHGGTFIQWAKYAPQGATVLGIDLPRGLWDEPGQINYKAIWLAASMRPVCVSALIGDSQHPMTIRAVRAAMPEIDFLFIDGDHSERGAEKDYLIYGSMVRPGGVIAFHDILPDETDARIEVHKVWQSIRPSYSRTVELLSAENQPARGIGVIYV